MKKSIVIMLSLAVITISSAYADEAGGRGQRLKGIDADGNGTISKSEFMAHANKEAEERFNKMDTNGDGQLSKEELAAVRDKIQQARGRRHSQ
jgi:Ca2+-binding EF-hand superfamily protein